MLPLLHQYYTILSSDSKGATGKGNLEVNRMTEMFCFQCEQTAGGTGCTRVGVCGKKPEVARKQDEVVCALVGLARAAEGKTPGNKAD